MTFTLVNDCYEPALASQKIAYLMGALAITFGLGVTLGGIIDTYFGWVGCFYAGAIDGFILLFFVARLPETQPTIDPHAFVFRRLIQSYHQQFQNRQLLLGGLIMGVSGCFFYVFSALAPFIAITVFGMSRAQYGFANMIPSFGLFLGGLAGATLSKYYPLTTLLRCGIAVTSTGVFILFIALWMHLSILFSLFLPMIMVYFGLCFITPNASSVAMATVQDKAIGSAVMNFINIGCSSGTVFLMSIFSIQVLLLPMVYLALCFSMMIMIYFFCSPVENKP